MIDVPTGEFRALVAEVAAMRAQMTSLKEAAEMFRSLTLPVDVIYRAGRSDERQAILSGSETRGTRRNPSRRHGYRTGHLSAVREGRTS